MNEDICAYPEKGESQMKRTKKERKLTKAYVRLHRNIDDIAVEHVFEHERCLCRNGYGCIYRYRKKR